MHDLVALAGPGLKCGAIDDIDPSTWVFNQAFTL